VVVTGVRGERALAERVTRRAGLPSERNLAGRLDLGAMAALVDSARLVVCGDTGVAHLASAYATPSVVLFGPVSPALWGPPDDPRHRALWHGEEQRGRVVAPGSLAAIDIAEVLDAVDEVLTAAQEPTA
jgi:ADP-heptose:LPS heptosyltransferase